ncbi:hypothetical protein [Rhodopseudomonas sp. AAP120]|uniref:hypothetical protein n=1 Tax=Rhodopseudomonas sp. AAP120 TaxID=1523430 RepID=UPI001FDAAE95|nr:hypothetical protein [Rhodopseudomonas sp. AAP120]
MSKRWLQDWLAKHPVDAQGRPFYSQVGRTKLFRENDIARILDATMVTPCRSSSSPPRKGKSPNWTIRGTYLGVRVDRSAGTPRKAVAEQQRKLLEGRIERGEFPEKPAAPSGETSIAAAVAYMRSGGERENLARLISYFGETPITDIGQTEIDAAALALYPTATLATRNRKVYTPVSAVLHRAGRDIQFKRPKGARGRIVTDFLCVDDAFAIIAAADRDDPASGMLLRFLLYTGCRISEADGATLGADRFRSRRRLHRHQQERRSPHGAASGRATRGNAGLRQRHDQRRSLSVPPRRRPEGSSRSRQTRGVRHNDEAPQARRH